MKKTSNVSVLFYDNKRRIQIRFEANVKLHYNNKLSKSTWNKTELQSRKCYMAPYIPSTKLEDWDPNIPHKYLKKDPEKKDSESGYNNFCVAEMIIDSVDILELHHDGHIRFRIDFLNNESYFIAA